MEATDDTVQMPPLLTKLADPVAVALVREWIAAMPSIPCGGEPDGGTPDGGPGLDAASDAPAD
jgi:hypothetical protein